MPNDASITKLLMNVVPDLANRCEKLIRTLRDQNVIVVPYMGYRTVDHQNTLFAQSRDPDTIQAEADRLRANKCKFLADRLLKAKNTPFGKRVTNVTGGFSWHNWGEAVDFYVATAGGLPIWNGEDQQYKTFGHAAKELGLTWGGDFKSLPDWGHVQLRPEEVLKAFSYVEIDTHFRLESVS